jgi:ABC-type sugar transport system substrate-binding protein
MNKRFAALAVLVAAAAATTGLVAGTSNGAAPAKPTIGVIFQQPGSPTAPAEETGARAAAAALGDTVAVTEDGANDGPTNVSAINSLIAQHVSAIAVQTGANFPSVDDALAHARSEGIATLSFEGSYSNSVWVSQSTSAQYADALADALARQMKQHGQFITVPCDSGYQTVSTWLTDADAYIQHRYPRMHRVAIVMGGTGNGAAGTLELRPLLKKYPHLRGFIFLCPGEAYTEGPQLVHAHEIGKVFAAGNGADCPPLYSAYADNVLSGAEEIVCAGDPNKLGYLTIWAADRLARSHTLTLPPGKYAVGKPVGTVTYFSRNEELNLGRPLTITKSNLTRYNAP